MKLHMTERGLGVEISSEGVIVPLKHARTVLPRKQSVMIRSLVPDV